MILPDYIRAVLADLEKKKAAGLLPAELLEPSPGLLRDICYRLCQKPYSRKDEPTLERFFGTAADQKARLKSIEGFKITQFKPLINFLNTPTIQPKLKTIELLAWLIDFKGRPYDLYGRLAVGAKDDSVNIEVDVRPEEVDLPEEVADEPNEGADTRLDSPKRRRWSNKKIKIVIAITIVLAAAASFLSMRSHKNSPHFVRIPAGSRACMIWADDHFQEVQCSQHFGDTLVFPLDSEKIINFWKITRPDTITEDALGSIWCVRYHGSYECYTDTGRHPIDTSLKLEKLTDYILMRYVNPKIAAIKMAQ